MDFVHGGDPYVRRRLYILSKVEGIYSAKETKEIDVCLLELRRRRRRRRRVAFTEGICKFVHSPSFVYFPEHLSILGQQQAQILNQESSICRAQKIGKSKALLYSTPN